MPLASWMRWSSTVLQRVTLVQRWAAVPELVVGMRVAAMATATDRTTRDRKVTPENSLCGGSPRIQEPYQPETRRLQSAMRLPSSSQCAATFLLGCTRGGSPGILG